MTTRWAPALTSSGSPAMQHDPEGSWVSLEDYHDAIARAEAAESGALSKVPVGEWQDYIEGVAKGAQDAIISLVDRAEAAEAEAAKLDMVADDWYASFAAEMKLRKAAEAKAEKLREALEELTNLMQGVIDGDYKPDSFTLQPARTALTQGGDDGARDRAREEGEK